MSTAKTQAIAAYVRKHGGSAPLRCGQKPPLPQVAITPRGFTAFAIEMSRSGPAVLAALQLRPHALCDLPPHTKAGLRTTLAALRDAADAALADLDPRPASDPLPPTPTPATQTHIAK